MGPLGAPIFSPTVEKSSLPGLDFTSPCAGLAARRHPLKMKRRVTLGDCHQQHLQHQSGHGGHRHGGGGRALQLRGQLLLQGDLQTALQHQGPALSGVSSSPVREEVQGRAWHGAAVMHLGGGLHGGGGGQWWQGTMRGTLHNETNKPRHTVPQRGGAGNETFMCKGCTLRIDTWYQATASLMWLLKPGTSTSLKSPSPISDLMYTNTAVNLNYSRRGQRNSSCSCIWYFLFVWKAILREVCPKIWYLPKGHLARWQRSLCSGLSACRCRLDSRVCSCLFPLECQAKKFTLACDSGIS